MEGPAPPAMGCLTMEPVLPLLAGQRWRAHAEGGGMKRSGTPSHGVVDAASWTSWLLEGVSEVGGRRGEDGGAATACCWREGWGLVGGCESSGSSAWRLKLRSWVRRVVPVHLGGLAWRRLSGPAAMCVAEMLSTDASASCGSAEELGWWSGADREALLRGCAAPMLGC